MDPTPPPDFLPHVPLMAVGMAHPNHHELAHQVVPKANPPFQPIQPSQAATDLAALTARAEAASTVDKIFSGQAPAKQAPAQQAAPARVRTLSPAPGSPPPAANQSGVITFPMTREVLAFLTEKADV